MSTLNIPFIYRRSKRFFNCVGVKPHVNSCGSFCVISQRKGERNRRDSRGKDRKDIPKLNPFASLRSVMINPQWLELLMSRTNLHGPKDVIKV